MALVGEGGEIVLSRKPLGVSHNGSFEALERRIRETSLGVMLTRALTAIHMYRRGSVLTDSRKTSLGDIASVLNLASDQTETAEGWGAGTDQHLADLADTFLNFLYEHMSSEVNGEKEKKDKILAWVKAAEAVFSELEAGTIDKESPKLVEVEEIIKSILDTVISRPSSTGETVVELS